ncbi:MAG TPA: hypothetical protein VFA96_09680 [Nocardioides sp.]|nr:hypothetical protein [Nocardioides sp.]
MALLGRRRHRRFGGTPPRCSCGWQAPAEKKKKAKQQVQEHMKTCEVRLLHSEAKARWSERFSA